MTSFEPIDESDPRLGDVYDELSLWASYFGSALLDRVPLRPGQRVLDVGCGPGFPALELGHALGPSSTVIGVDVWASVLARAHKKKSFFDARHVCYVRGDGARLPVRDESVDLVVSNLGVNNFPDPAASMRECRRVLRSTGSLWLSTNLRGHMREFYDAFRSVLEEANDQASLARLRKQEDHRVTAEGLTGTLREAGFSSVQTFEDEFALRYADGAAFFQHGFIRLGFLAGWLPVVPEAKRQELFTRVEGKLNEISTEQGELRLTIPRCVMGAMP